MKEIVITSSVLILALLVLRLVFAKKVSRRLIYAAWLLVALRLLIPVQVGRLDFSVLTAAQPLTDTISEFTDLRVAGQTKTDAQKQVIAQYIEDDLSVFEDAVQNRIEEAQRNYYTTEEIAQMVDKIYSVDTAFKPDAQDQVSREIEARTNPVSLGNVLTVIWLVGVAAMGGWFLFVNLRYGKNLRRDAQRLDCDSPIPVYVSEFADSPCLAGLLRPTIYMNPYCAESEEMRRHVLTHELTHYRHKDHLWNLVRCLCLCVYWFHPLVWVAVYVCRRDCELACDEGVMEKLGDDERISYGKTLLEVVRHRLYPSDWLQTATSMTETKRELKNRVNFIAKKSRISFIAAVAMVLVCAIVTGCVAAGPSGEKEYDDSQAKTYISIISVEEQLAVVYNDQLILTKYSLQGKLTPILSLDGEEAVCRIPGGGLLYIYDGQVETVADHIASYSLSVYGDAVAFYVDEKNAAKGSQEAGLYLYQKQTKQAQKIQGTDEGYVQSYALSPDGKTLACTVTKDQYDMSEPKLVVYREGSGVIREESLEKIYCLISIDNSCQYMYVYDLRQAIYSVDPQGKMLKLGSINNPEWEYASDRYSVYGYVYCNADHTQLLIFGRNLYLSKQGQESEQLSNGGVGRPIEPDLTTFHQDRMVITCDFADMSKMAMRTQRGGMLYPGGDGYYEIIAELSGFSSPSWLDFTGRHLYYRQGNTEDGYYVYRMDLQNLSEPVKLAESQYGYAVSHDAATLYCVTRFLDDRQEGIVKYTYLLHQVDGQDGSVQKEIEIDELQQMFVSENNQLFFLTVNMGQKNLYTLNEKAEAELVLENVVIFEQETTGMIYVKTEDNEHYVIRAGRLIRLEMKK